MIIEKSDIKKTKYKKKKRNRYKLENIKKMQRLIHN